MNYSSPKDIAVEFCCAGLNKAKMPTAKFALLAFLGGTFIAFGGLLTVVVAGDWLVCLGAWMGFAGKDVVSKCVGIWVPVMIFVALGYEHSIANMFFVPAAIYSGANLLWTDFIIHNLIPATLGNIVGGAALVASIYWYVYMNDNK